MKDIYERLRERLNDLATGYPATESGVEIRILKRLFTEEEAGKKGDGHENIIFF